MFFLQAQDFDSESTGKATTTKMIFKGQWLIKSCCWDKHQHEKAIATYSEHLEARRICILVESQTDLNIWLQKTEEVSHLQPELLKLIRQQLIKYVMAPVAERLVSKTLKQYPRLTATELIKFLASKIHNTLQAEKFQK